MNNCISAFPVQSPVYSEGMDLRDWFAGQVLGNLTYNLEGGDLTPESAAIYAYKVADKMLERRGNDRQG